jgi:hypothetical protein
MSQEVGTVGERRKTKYSGAERFIYVTKDTSERCSKLMLGTMNPK